jgi:hypothetical protein
LLAGRDRAGRDPAADVDQEEDLPDVRAGAGDQARDVG